MDDGLNGFVDKPAKLQIAALCYRPSQGEPEILLVSSRQQGRWILPKGWPMSDKPPHETAAIEAFEEAGAVGEAEQDPLGTFNSFKGLSDGKKLKTKVLVFKIRVDEMLVDFPEKGQRKLAWVQLSEAVDMADEATLSAFLTTHGPSLN